MEISKDESIHFVEKGDILTHYIQPLCITKESVKIKVSINKPVSKKTKFYIHQCGKEDEDYLALIEVRRNKKEGSQELDLAELEEMGQKSPIIALYREENDKQPISNKVHITIPGIFTFKIIYILH